MLTVSEVLTQHYPQLQNRPLLAKPLIFCLKKLCHETDIQGFVQQYPHLSGIDFVEQVLDYFEATYSYRDNEILSIPKTGKVIIVANHPLGSLDGLALLKLIHAVRPDVKVMANQLLTAITHIESLLLPVNNTRSATSKHDVKKVHAHLQNEGAVLMFPAGEVSRLRPQGVRDTQWRLGFLKLAKQYHAPILPMYIEAKNSPLFYSLSMLYKPLASALLIKEMFKQRATHFPVRIGQIIPPQAYDMPDVSIKHICKLFKKHVYALGHDKSLVFKTQAPIALPEDKVRLKHALLDECESLGHTDDGKAIYLYRHSGSSVIMREIGRLREIAFRAVGEGTWTKRDIDRYDQSYLHLVLWDPNALEIVGAYRFGCAKDVHDVHGSDLYSQSLFQYNQTSAPMFAKGLELGRSFVQPRYWGKRSLDYLWFGIGAYLNRYPDYQYLFGPVSLSNTYSEPAKQMIVAFYQRYFGTSSPCAIANVPYRIQPDMLDVFDGEDYQADLVRLKHMLKAMGYAIPTLFKQYTELTEASGTAFHAFGVDPDFSHCVDGLIVVDLHKLKQKKYNRYIAKHP